MGGARLRVLLGSAGRLLRADGVRDAAAHTLHDHAAVRSHGLPAGRPCAHRAAHRSGDMISDATFIGAIQVPPSGDPILLMADRQTTGGYPQIATVITADLPLAGQLAPGDWVEFELCTRAEAIAALAAQEGQASCAPLSARATRRPMCRWRPSRTLGIGGDARWFVRAATVDEVAAAHAWAREPRPRPVRARRRQQPGHRRPRVRWSRAADRHPAASTSRRDGDDTLVRVGAGEPWDDSSPLR